jgi:glutamate--cysteine ligase
MHNLILNKEDKKAEIPNILDILKDIIASRKEEVDAWFTSISEKSPPFFYNSVDLRHSGFKLAPVDTNLFPAGFNNLNEQEQKDAVDIAKSFFEQYHPQVKKVLILAEDHTRNLFYLDNITALIKIISDAGQEVVITNLATCKTGEEITLENSTGGKLLFKPAINDNGVLKTLDGFVPDMVIVNNDLTEGAPELLDGIKQIVSPPTWFGWHQRRKTSHFETYNNIAREFANKFGIDSWLISTYFQRCGVVNFKERTGLECVAMRVDKTLSMIRAKYEEYGITEDPYVFIKSDRGTYGMGIMTAKSGDEVFEMGKDIRKKMNTIKGGVLNTEVIIQEGVLTIDRVDGNPAEPMMYIMGGEPVGCIYRLNTKKDSYGNLNASGMSFTSIGLHVDDVGLCQSYGLIAKLASHAAAWECYVDSYNI